MSNFATTKKYLVTCLLLSLCFCCTRVHADYAWIPDYQQLQIRGGIDFFSSSNNYANDGFSDPIRLGGQTATFSDRIVWLEPQFGIAEDWSMGLHLGFFNATVTNAGDEVLASGAGIGDLRGSVKWRISRQPLWTLETLFKLPTGFSVPSTGDEIVAGEGNLDLGLKIHYGYRTQNFFFSIAPGLLARTGGYSSAATADASVQMFIYRAYAKVFLSSIASFNAQALPPGNLTTQAVPGSGGSYARLAASPTGITAGGSLGVLISKQLRLEGSVSRAVLGERYPEFLSFSVSLLALFDFAKPDLRPKLREVPFENAPEAF